MNKKPSISAARQMNASDFALESTKRQARFDRAKIKKMDIKSPDVSKMHSVTYGNSTYYFKNKKKLDKFIRENKHYEILGMKIPEEDQHKPIINERFSKLNQKIDNNESQELPESTNLDVKEGFPIRPTRED